MENYKLLPLSKNHSYRLGYSNFYLYENGTLVATEKYEKPLDIRAKVDFPENDSGFEVEGLEDYLVLKIKDI